ALANYSFSSRILADNKQQVPPTFVKPFNLVEPIENQAPPVVTMDDTRTMAQLLEAPTVGYEDAIVVPEITADNFELKHGLLTLVQNKQFFGHDKEDPHAHIRYFNKITSTMKFPNDPGVFNGSGTLPSNTITNPKVDLKGITIGSGVAYQGPTIPTTSSSLPKVVERETEVTKDKMPPTNNGSTKDVQPPVVQVQSHVPNYELMAIPLLYYDPVVIHSSPTLTLRDSDFLLEEVDAFLSLEDDPTSPKVAHSYYDPEGDILLLEAFLSDDPSLPPPTQGNYLPKFKKNLKFMKLKLIKSSMMNL
ncbi:hypothetical protein Tco_0092059, partial [Tanacetum coccineum]